MDVIAKELSFSYNKGAKFAVVALDNVDLNIKEGEFCAIIGQTGSGKSTFIQHINALIPVQSGKLIVGDRDLSVHDKKAKKSLKQFRRNVGMVFQYPEYQLFAETVKEDVAFGIKNFMDVTEEELTLKVKAALETVGLDYEQIKDKSPFELSGGQKRRVAIAGVIAVEPEILILDEPCAGLDPQGKTELWNMLHSIHGKKVKTVIVVSHDMNDVAEQCASAVLFKDGKVLASGSPKQLFSDTELIESAGLEVPVTRYLEKELEPLVHIDSDFKTEDFSVRLANIIKEKNFSDYKV